MRRSPRHFVLATAARKRSTLRHRRSDLHFGRAVDQALVGVGRRNRILGRGSALCPSTAPVEGSRLIFATASSFAGRLTSLAVRLGALV
jgi:hypothetical protein